MDKVTTVAVAKGIKSAVVRELSNELSVGQHKVDTYVHVSGIINKAEDEVRLAHMAVPQWKLISILFSKLNGVTVESIIREMIDTDDDKVTDIKKQAEEAIKKIKGEFEKVHYGKVTTKLAFEEVPFGQMASEKTATAETAEVETEQA